MKDVKNYLQGLQGVIFDYGGTIDSCGRHWSEVIYDGWKNAGLDVDKDVFRQAYVYAERELARVRHIMPDDDFHALLLKKMRIELQWMVDNAGFPAAQVEEKAAAIADYCDSEARRWVEHSIPVIQYLGERYPLVLVSNFYGNVEAVLKEYGLRHYFKAIVESAVVGVRKPDPKIFTLGVEALGVPAADVLVIGDSYRKDILPALAAGCRAVWIKGKGWTYEEDAQEYDYVVHDLDELIQFVP